jgi:ligand-binding sensor domain-containing protein
MNYFTKIIVIPILLIGLTLCFTSCKPKPTLAVVTTTNVTDKTQTTATSGGNVTDDGNAEVTARGVCWGTAQNPTTGSSKTSDGIGTGAFTSSLTGLTPGTTYYVRAYATNSEGTAYGSEVSFNSNPVLLATLTTATTTSITQTTAVSGGNITLDGGGAITGRGVCWSTSANPTTALTTKTSDGAGTGAFTSNISGLTANTKYYIRAYAVNSAGTAYGDDLPLTTEQQLQWTSFNTSNGLAGNNVMAIAIDAQGIKWFGTNGGVSKFDNTTWTTYTTSNGLAGNNVYAVAIDAQGNKWFGTDRGVSKFDGATWTTYTHSDGLSDGSVVSIAFDSQGNKWFGHWGGSKDGVTKFDGTNWTIYTTTNGLAGNGVSAIAIDAQGNKWFATLGGVSKFDGTNWTTYTTLDGLASNNVYSIAIDAQNNKWFGTWSGVSRFNGTAWTTYTYSDGLGYPEVRAITIDAQGNKWFGTTAGGVSKFDGTNWTTYTNSNGLAGTNVHAIAIDAQGNKWFGTNGGVSKLSD